MASPATISSMQTFMAKFVTLPISFAVILLMALGMFFSSGRPEPAAIGFLIAFVFIYGTWAWKICLPLKRVHMDDRALYISNYFTEIEVPLSNVAEVTENRWLREHPVTIRFHSETEFGSRIVFLPTMRLFGFWTSHPVVEQIRWAVAQATGSAPAGPVE